MKIISKKLNARSGFTLIELVVAIGIFGIILVLMSNIVISMAKFALDNERRNDFIAELDGASNVIKNDLRSAQELSLCSDGKLFRKTTDTSGVTEYYKLTVENDRLEWLQKSDTCADLSSPKRFYLTSSEIIKIDAANPNSVVITSASDSKSPGQVTNTLLYIKVTACSPDAIPVGGQIFNCTNNPYKYTFAISTRNIF